MKNVEIKAVVRNLNTLIETAKTLSNSGGDIIKQHDTFYKVCTGRLKMRKFEDGHAELIYYDRPDTEGPKLSSYEKSDISNVNVDSLHNVLSKALTCSGVVIKTRQLFMIGQTRVHIDSVENLGNFMELEVVLRPDQSPDDGEAIARNLMKDLGISNDDLISGAYTDLLQKKEITQ